MTNVTIPTPGHDGRREMCKSWRSLMRGTIALPEAIVDFVAPASAAQRAAGPLSVFRLRGPAGSLFDGRVICSDMDKESSTVHLSSKSMPSTLRHARARALMLRDGHTSPVAELPLPSTLLTRGSTEPQGMPWRGPLLDTRTTCMTVVVADIEIVGPVPKFMGRRQALASLLNQHYEN